MYNLWYRVLVRSIGTAIALAALAVAAVAQSPPPAGAPAVMIIVDGSGSMWGKIDGDKNPKFAVARQALRAPLTRIAGKARLGLMSFGHRRQGNCGDIETIAAPEAGSADRILGPLDKLNPRGKGPIAAALREAGKVLAGKGPGSIVLVHDNADNCQQDVCAAADELARAGVKVFAVGIGLEGDEPQRMACVASATGGRFVNAGDAAALAVALNDSIDLAVQGRVTPPPPAPDTAAAKSDQPDTAAAKGPRALPPDAPPGLALTAQLGSDGGILAEGVRWRILASDGKVLRDMTGGELLVPLPPGKYMIEATAGLASATQSAEVGSGAPTRVTLQLQAGAFSATVRAGKASEPLAKALLSLLPAAGKNVAAAAQPVWIARAGRDQLVVPPGNYVLRAEAGTVRQDVPVAVTIGKSIPVDIVLGAGRLQLSAQAGDDGEALPDVIFSVAEDDPDAPQGRREIARSAALHPEFVLPAGTYYVTARVGQNEIRQRIALGAGDTVSKVIPLGLSKLTVTVAAEGALARGDAGVEVRIWRLDQQPPREVARSQQARSEFLLTPGRHRIEAMAGAQNARAEGEVELKPGRNAQASVKLDAAVVALRALDTSGTPLADTFWEIRDGRGRIVWRTSQSEPKALLAPGHYVVRSETRAATLERTLDLAAGDVRTLDLKAEAR